MTSRAELSRNRENTSSLHKKLLRIKYDKVLYLMLLPTIVYFIIFRILPIYNMRLAFYDFHTKRPWNWAGIKYFRQIFKSPAFWEILKNTLIISFQKYVLLFPVFPIFAILLNELKSDRMRKYVQVVSYLPHFLSWVVVAGIWIAFLSPRYGAVNQIITFFGGTPVDFMQSKGWIRWILMLCEGWRSLGWTSIIPFTAILSIENALFEAAEIDGANRLQKIIYIILPALVPTMATMFILNLGYFLNAGFDQVYNFTNNSVNSVIDILDTYINRLGIEQGQYSLGTAVGLMQGVVGIALVMVTHFASKRATGKGVW